MSESPKEPFTIVPERLTFRERLVLYACLSYACSNTDDVNEALSTESGDIIVSHRRTAPIEASEVVKLAGMCGVDIEVAEKRGDK